MVVNFSPTLISRTPFICIESANSSELIDDDSSGSFTFNPWPEINQAEVSDNNETTTEKTDNEVENLEAEEAIEGEVISASDQEEEEK